MEIEVGFGITIEPIEKEFYKGSEKYLDYEIKNNEVKEIFQND